VKRIRPADITGLVLCGGRGSRMGGADKGLVHLHGQPLVAHALARLQSQVGPIAVNANRNLPAYAALGLPLWPDTEPNYPGPLAGWLVGLQRASTPYVATVPCDAPHFPLDVVARLAAALSVSSARLAYAATEAGGAVQAQPVFALMECSLHAELRAYVSSGSRKVQAWLEQQQAVQVLFEDAAAFANANRAADLTALHKL
jgi:molybdenum cofactor guanylyltransferase